MPEYIVHKAVELKNIHKTGRVAAALREDPDYVARTFLRQLKKDGCNTVVIWDGKTADVRSRTNEVVHSFGHLLEDLRHLPPGVYLGEAWKAGLEFADISGIFRRKTVKEGSELLELHVFDFLTREEFGGQALRVPDFQYRAYRLAGLLRGALTLEHVRLVQALEPPENASQEELEALALRHQGAGGHDGLICRDPRGGWIAGDSGKRGEIIKIKPTLSLDLRVLEVEVGAGEKTGRTVYSLVVDLGAGQRQVVGSGVPHNLDAVPSPGCLVEVEALGWTKAGQLREPRYRGMRFDKLEADR